MRPWLKGIALRGFGIRAGRCQFTERCVPYKIRHQLHMLANHNNHAT